MEPLLLLDCNATSALAGAERSWSVWLQPAWCSACLAFIEQYPEVASNPENTLGSINLGYKWRFMVPHCAVAEAAEGLGTPNGWRARSHDC